MTPPRTRELKPGWVYVTLVNGVEGAALYINGRRVVGPKPWGGGSVAWERAVQIDRIYGALPSIESVATSKE